MIDWSGGGFKAQSSGREGRKGVGVSGTTRQCPTHRLKVRKSDTNFGQSLDTLTQSHGDTLPIFHNFECAFVRMDTLNLTAKFEDRSFTRSRFFALPSDPTPIPPPFWRCSR